MFIKGFFPQWVLGVLYWLPIFEWQWKGVPNMGNGKVGRIRYGIINLSPFGSADLFWGGDSGLFRGPWGMRHKQDWKVHNYYNTTQKWLQKTRSTQKEIGKTNVARVWSSVLNVTRVIWSVIRNKRIKNLSKWRQKRNNRYTKPKRGTQNQTIKTQK